MKSDHTTDNTKSSKALAPDNAGKSPENPDHARKDVREKIKGKTVKYIVKDLPIY